MSDSADDDIGDSIVVLDADSSNDSLFINDILKNSTINDFNDVEIIDINEESNIGDPPESMIMANNIVSSCSMSEIQQKLANLLDENNLLRETLKQNNSTIKEQFDTIVSWRDDVMKTYSLHRDKFIETKTFIEKLKKENTQQKNELEKMKTFVLSQYNIDNVEKSHMSYENLVDDSKIDLLTDHVQALEKDKRQLLHDNEELERQNESLQKIINANESCIQNLQSRLDTSGNEEIILKDNVRTLERRVSSLQEEIKNSQYKLSEYETAKLESSQYKQQTQNCIRHLKIELQEIKSKLKDAYIMTLQPVKSSLNLEECQENKSYSKICSNAEIYDKILKNFTSDLNNYVTQFFTLYESFVSVSNSLNNKIPDSGYEQIKKDLSTFTKNADVHLKFMAQQNHSIKNHLSGFESIFHDLKQAIDVLKANKVEYNECSAELVTKKEELEVCMEELESLRKLATTIQKDSEQMDLLKAQIEVYKTDFEAERQARTEIASEKQSLVEQLRALHTNNQKLTEECDSLRSEQNIPGPSASELNFTEIFKCPLCEEIFVNQNTLEAHVYSCLDKNG